MLALATAGFLAAAIAAATEILVLTPADEPLTQTERSLRLVATAYVAGLAVLGVVMAILAIAIRQAAEPSSLHAAVSASGIVAGALGIALSWRGRPDADRPELERAQRTLLMVRFAAFQAVGVAGFLIGVVPLFLG
jgi:hypothetical protein